MACETAFRLVAGRSISDLATHHETTCRGDPTALHQMRVALTRLRTAILFFSPMVADTRRARIRQDLKWLNRHLGAVRDLDVAIERLKAAGTGRSRRSFRIVERETRGRPSPAGARSSIDQIRPPDQEHIRLDRPRPLVDQDRPAGRGRARRADRQ